MCDPVPVTVTVESHLLGAGAAANIVDMAATPTKVNPIYFFTRNILVPQTVE